MFKIILIFVLFIYAIFRIGGFLVKILSFGSDQKRTQQKGNVHVDSNPKQDKKSFDGGEYVDYEDVKWPGILSEFPN